jgi:capsular exopolysaccharide synthesis family protein
MTEPTGASPDDGPVVDFRAILAIFRRHQWLFVAVATLIMAAVVAYTLTRPRLYTASAAVLVQPQQVNVLKDQDPDTDTSSSQIDTELEIIGSREMSERVVLAEKLRADPEFNTPASKAGQETDRRQAVIEAVHNRTSVRRSGLTRVIQVSFTAGNPQKAARLANAVAREFILSQTEAKYALARKDNSWITDRLLALGQEVQANDAAVQQYKIAHNLMSAQGATMAEQEVSTLNQQIAIARAELSERQGRLAAAQGQISRGGGGGDIGAVLDSPVVRDLRSQRAAVTRRQAELQTRYGPLHPDVQKVERELADTDRQIAEEIGRTTSNLQAEVQVAQQRLSSLQGSRGAAQGSLGSNSRALVTLNELERKAEASRAIYEAFLNRSKETSAQEGLQRPDARISSTAQPPRSPSSPKKTLNFALGFVLALSGGVGAVIAAEILNGTLRTSSEVERKLRAASLGSIPLLRKMSSRAALDYVVSKPFSGFAEAFRNLRTSLELASPDAPPKIVVLTSAIPGEGKSLTAVAFARSAALAGMRVLLIDADTRRHALSSSIWSPGDDGLVELLNGDATLEMALQTDPASGARLLLLSKRAPPAGELFRGERFDQLLAAVRRHFDLVIIDTAPVLAVAETRILAAKADATIYLVRWSKTPLDAARAGLDLLQSSGVRVAGVCLTQVDVAAQSRSGYGDSLHHYSKYKKYYTE